MEKLRRNKEQRTGEASLDGFISDETISSPASINYGGKLKLLMMTTIIFLALD